MPVEKRDTFYVCIPEQVVVRRRAGSDKHDIRVHLNGRNGFDKNGVRSNYGPQEHLNGNALLLAQWRSGENPYAEYFASQVKQLQNNPGEWVNLGDSERKIRWTSSGAMVLMEDETKGDLLALLTIRPHFVSTHGNKLDINAGAIDCETDAAFPTKVGFKETGEEIVIFNDKRILVPRSLQRGVKKVFSADEDLLTDTENHYRYVLSTLGINSDLREVSYYDFRDVTPKKANSEVVVEWGDVRFRNNNAGIPVFDHRTAVTEFRHIYLSSQSYNPEIRIVDGEIVDNGKDFLVRNRDPLLCSVKELNELFLTGGVGVLTPRYRYSNGELAEPESVPVAVSDQAVPGVYAMTPALFRCLEVLSKYPISS